MYKYVITSGLSFVTAGPLVSLSSTKNALKFLMLAGTTNFYSAGTRSRMFRVRYEFSGL
jgi:hypothetical protein